MLNSYPGRCVHCFNPIGVGQGNLQLVNGYWILAHKRGCLPIPQSFHASGDFALSKNIGGHEFKPDASEPNPGAKCSVCGTENGVAWIAGAGRYMCYSHQDDY